MKEFNKDDLKINGNMSLKGGKYNKVVINGSGEIQTDLTADIVKVNGSGSFEGIVKAETCKISGSTRIAGKAEFSTLRVSGSLRANSDLKADDIKTTGELIVQGSIAAKKIKIVGETNIKNNCNADVITCTGEIKVGKELIADEIVIDLYGRSSAGEIGGGNIKIRRYPENKISKFLHTIFLIELFRSASMKTDIIEGDEIYLEFTKAKVVRGKNVKIGPGCEIDYVEYSESFIRSEKAVIKKEMKV
jgi:cytoskeletal protein CcmA (bactofilin family)